MVDYSRYMTNPMQGVNQGLSSLTEAMKYRQQADRQAVQDEQAGKLHALQLQQGQQTIDSNKLSLSKLQGEQSALVNQYGTQGQTDPYGQALSFRAEEAKQAEAQKAAMEKSKFAMDSYIKVQDAVKSRTLSKEQAGPYYHNLMKSAGLDLDSAGMKVEFSDNGGYFSGPIAPDDLVMMNGKAVPYGASGIVTKARIAGIDPATNEPILEMDESTTFTESKSDQEALLDKRFDNQRQLTQMQIDAQDRRAAADRVATDKRANKKDAAKPLPVSALKMQQEGVDAIGTASGIRADLGELRMQVETGALDLGPMKNLWNKGRNWAGWSSKESRNLQSFTATLQKLRNDSLRLNKGVQTDGDAQRAWAELIDNINDPKAVTQRLQEIDAINERAVTLHQANIDNIRNNYGQPPLDTSAQTNVKPALGKPAASSGKQGPKLSKKAQSIADRY